MYNSRKSHQRVRLLAVLSALMLLTSVFPWYGATAQDGEGADTTVTATPSITWVGIECTVDGTDAVTASLAVTSPNDAVTATVELFANTATGPVKLDDATAVFAPLNNESVTVGVQLPASAAQVSDSVVARAYITGEDPSTAKFSDTVGLPIHAGGEGSLCGTAPTTSGETGTSDTDEVNTVIPPAVTSVSLACVAEASETITATVGVSDPPTDGSGSVSVQLYAGVDPIGSETSAPIGGQTSVSVPVTLPASDIGVTTVSASAWITGDTSSTSVRTATDLSVHYSADAGAMLCGVAPEAPSPSATATSTPEPTATATSTSTATSTASPEQTETPTPSPTATESPTPTTQYATVVNTSGADLRCRATPVSGATLGLFAAGSRVQLRGAESNGWYPVVCPNGEDGYSSGEYLRLETTTPPTSGGDGDTSSVAIVQGTSGDGLRCRTAPVSGATITVLADGTRVPMRGAVENGWAPVTCSGQAGWISTQYARIETSGGTTDPTPTPAPGTGTGKYGTVVNTGGMGLRCRTAPVSGAIIMVVPEGTKLETRGDAVNNWYPVICNGQAGHVSGDYFTLSTSGGTTTPPVTGGTSTAMVSGTGGGGLRCRTEPVTGNTITILPEGSLVDVRGSVVNGWAPVKCAGQNGWSSAAYLTFNVSGATGELWIDVNLSSQYMRVYRGSTVIASTYVSTGRPGFDTPTGTFYINWKLPSQTMTGVLGGEYYYVPNVPWVMYFTNVGHAIHGAYWHNNFGYVMSHGCVNLPVSFAEWLYSITPYGTRVRIHY